MCGKAKDGRRVLIACAGTCACIEGYVRSVMLMSLKMKIIFVGLYEIW